MRRGMTHLGRKAVLSGAAALLLATLMPATGAWSEEAGVPENDLLNATLWMQRSAEYKAVTLSLYTLAKLRLDEALDDKSWTAVPDKQGEDFADQPPAVILDADETVLDNSVYQASLVTRRTSFHPDEWTEYVNDEVTTAVSGALDFTQYAASKGVKVFYVSNRTEEEEPATRRNMEALGFPMGDNVDTILTKGEKKGWGSAKGSRIAFVAKDYRVLLLIGDNLGDFTDKYKGTMEERDAFIQQTKDHWGREWIMLPNPEYGSWETAAFGGDYSLSPDKRRQMKIDALRPWHPQD